LEYGTPSRIVHVVAARQWVASAAWKASNEDGRRSMGSKEAAEQVAYDRLKATQKRLEEVWPDRETTKKAETRAAIDEVNDAGMELNRVQEESDSE